MSRRAAGDGGSVDLERWERRLFAVAVAVAIAPFWVTRWTPLMDGPIHLYVLEVLRSFVIDGAASPYRGVFELNAWPEPNLGFYLLGLPLSLVLPLPVVEKLVLSLAVGLFCVGGASLLRGLGGQPWAFATLLVPLSTHLFVHQGFHNSVLGIAVALVSLALAVRHPPAWRWRRLLAYAAGSVGLFTVHVMALATFGLALGWYLVGAAAARWLRERRLGAALRDVMSRGTALAVSAVPALALTVSFLLRHGGTAATTSDDSLRARVADVVWLTWLTGYSTVELLWLAPFVLTVAMLAIVAAFRLRGAERAAVARLVPSVTVTIGLAMVVLAGIGNARDVGVADRLTVVVAVAALGVIAAGWLGPSARRVALALALTVTAVDAAHRVFQYHRHSAALDAYVALTQGLAPGSALLGVALDEGSMAWPTPALERPTYPLRHAAALAAIERRGPYLGATLLSRGRFGYFPIVYVPDADPFPRIGAHESVPPRLDLAAYEATGGLRLDAVILIGDADDAVTLAYLADAEPWHSDFELAARDPRYRLHLLTRRD